MYIDYWLCIELYLLCTQEEEGVRRAWLCAETHSTERDLLTDSLCPGWYLHRVGGGFTHP